MFEHKEKPTTEVAPEEEKLGLLAVYLLGIPLCLGTDIAGDESSIIWGIEKEQGKEEEEEGEEQEGMEEEPAALSMVMNQMMEEDYDYPADVPMDQEDEHIHLNPDLLSRVKNRRMIVRMLQLICQVSPLQSSKH